MILYIWGICFFNQFCDLSMLYVTGNCQTSSLWEVLPRHQSFNLSSLHKQKKQRPPCFCKDQERSIVGLTNNWLPTPASPHGVWELGRCCVRAPCHARGPGLCLTAHPHLPAVVLVKPPSRVGLRPVLLPALLLSACTRLCSLSAAARVTL